MENNPDSCQPLQEWCRLFVDSPQYRKAILDARYTRQEAATDFLRAYFQDTGQAQPTPAQLLAWADLILRNYYRFF